mmetsp:Transcript_63740/g.75413  ORF Transcript_63740/g.75413 Transcript_63740/m.75413 type:complete len:84 (+) Transcript_63740:28-279(+)
MIPIRKARDFRDFRSTAQAARDLRSAIGIVKKLVDYSIPPYTYSIDDFNSMIYLSPPESELALFSEITLCQGYVQLQILKDIF